LTNIKPLLYFLKTHLPPAHHDDDINMNLLQNENFFC
jgi:hypothetical protein